MLASNFIATSHAPPPHTHTHTCHDTTAPSKNRPEGSNHCTAWPCTCLRVNTSSSHGESSWTLYYELFLRHSDDKEGRCHRMHNLSSETRGPKTNSGIRLPTKDPVHGNPHPSNEGAHKSRSARLVQMAHKVFVKDRKFQRESCRGRSCGSSHSIWASFDQRMICYQDHQIFIDGN